jgi:cobalt-zinc-cadmium efflux system outer membrane protein
MRYLSLMAGTLALVWISPLADRSAEGQSPAGASPSSSTPTTPGLGVAPGGSPGQNTTIYGGAPGFSPGRYQPGLTGTSTPRLTLPPGVELPAPLPGREVVQPKPLQPGLPEPVENPWIGKANGITLDQAIDQLCRHNLDLQVQFSAIPQAEADVLTASLRTNPILYADSQQIPYGNYSGTTAGGPLQYDLNAVYPVDWSGKRKARTKAADLALRATRASYRDAVRLTIDNLYKAYVDALVAQRDYKLTRPKDSGIPAKDIGELISVDEPESALEQTQRTLALLLDLPFELVKEQGVRGRLAYRQKEEPDLPADAELVGRATEYRADVITQGLIVDVAEANYLAVKANRFDDVLVLYQPYTAHDGRPFGQRNVNSWALGVTIPLPVYNRQQGNLLKARQIADQARLKLLSVRKTVDAEVRSAILEHKTAHQAVKRTFADLSEAIQLSPIETDSLPSTYDGQDEKLKAVLKSVSNTIRDSNAVLQALRNDNEDDKGRKYKEAQVRHRRSMLRLNTVLGERWMP